MVEREEQLDRVFACLSDPTRRDMVKRITKRSMSIGQIAEHYTISFAAVSKHVNVLVNADIVTKTRHGKEQVVSVKPDSLALASRYLEQYRELWEQRLDSLELYLKKKSKGR